MYVILGGDTMLGRLVRNEIIKQGPDFPLGAIASLMRSADLTIVNLECAITDSIQQWQGGAKAFYFAAPTQAVKSLVHSGINLVSLANNHILDFEVIGLKDTLKLLQQNDIQFAGAGDNLTEAKSPAIITINDLSFGMQAYCDHQADFAATMKMPGMNYLDLSTLDVAIRQLQKDFALLKEVDWPILSLHWGPNMVLHPSRQFIEFAHAAIDIGYKIVFGHSAHVFHGIELYKDCPIIYAAGDLVDDYYVDPNFKNNHQCLFELNICEEELKSIKLYPVIIESCHTRRAKNKEFEFISNRAQKLCAEFGTDVIVKQDHLKIEV